MERAIDLLKSGSSYLAQAKVYNPLCESEIILSHLLNCGRTELYLDDLTLEKERSKRYRKLLSSRVRGFPLQYLLGSTEFMGLEFKVRRGVFIPRPETEILAGTVIDILAGKPEDQQIAEVAILDLGTGCGNIAISLAKYLKKGRIFACDISETALQLTKENSYLNKVNIHLVRSDLFSVFKKQNYFSLIVSNPPYIRTQEFPKLARELQYEPREAFDGGKDGLSYYFKIIKEAPVYLRNGGKLCLEIGDNQRNSLEEILAQCKDLSLIKVIRDYNNVERVVVAQKSDHDG